MGNISYSFIHAKKLIIEVYQGTISADIFYNYQNELLNDPEFDPTYSYFTDIRKSVIQLTDEEREKCDAFYSLLVSEGYEVLYDDRKVSPGFKFADADLVGIPIRVTIGKSYYNNGEIEIKLRKETELQKISEEELVPKIKESISNY